MGLGFRETGPERPNRAVGGARPTPILLRSVPGPADVTSAGAGTATGGPTAPIPPEARRWLHDKYERLAAEEGQLSSSRTTYYAAIGTVLITGLIVVSSDFMNDRLVLAVFVTFLATLGLLISAVWAVLLHRTNDAQNLWREAARRLEETNPPVEGSWNAAITLRSGTTLEADLLRPFLLHEARFSRRPGVPWMDRVDPTRWTGVLPVTFLAIWTVLLGGVWVWYLLLH
jgi:hypothetical protein